MLSRALFAAVVLAACGGGQRIPSYVTLDGPLVKLEPREAARTWYRSPSICGQGPWEIEVPLANARWGEEIELRLATPHRIVLHAAIIADDVEIRAAKGTFDDRGQTRGRADNARCVANLEERLAAGSGGTGSGGGTVVTTGVKVVEPPRPGVTPPLEVVLEDPVSVSIVQFRWEEKAARAGRVRIRLWSIDPNDVERVRFGVIRREWKPNVPEAEYETRLAAQNAEYERKVEELRRRREEQEARKRKTTTTVVVPKATYKVEVDDTEERLRRRQVFCAAHLDDRDCWGPGGMRGHMAAELREKQRATYCASALEDARCWASDRWGKLGDASRARIRAALAPPPQPDGPPPAALEETQPPMLSAHAEWRPGYWQWTGQGWTWLAGMWRVPDSDIETEQTTAAPSAPPPPRTETIPPPPMATTAWVTGFWQWSGTAWVWVAGSYQARPGGMQWRPTTWKARGNVHVLVPGGWVRIGGRR